MCDKCELTEFGCCDDLENAAKGPDFEGCPTGNSTAFVDCTTTVNTVNIFLLGPLKMTKTPKLTDKYRPIQAHWPMGSEAPKIVQKICLHV